MKESAKMVLQTDKVYDPAKHKGLLTVEYGATSTVSIESIMIQSEWCNFESHNYSSGKTKKDYQVNPERMQDLQHKGRHRENPSDQDIDFVRSRPWKDLLAGRAIVRSKYRIFRIKMNDHKIT